MLTRIRRELHTFAVLARTALRMARVKPENDDTVADAFERVVDAYGDRPAIVFEGRTMTYRELERAANRVANWARAHGLHQGRCAALFMENRAEYLATWLGLAKTGAHVALINTNLTGGPLVHALTVAEPVLVIVGTELE